MKDISLRPKKQLMNLFEAVQNLEILPSTNRNSIVDRALDVALKSNHVNWQAVSEISIDDHFNESIPAHIVLKVDKEKFSKVNEQIKTTFNAEKITIPYTLKLLLTLYFVYLKQQTDTASQDDKMSELLTPEIKVDTLILKNEYEQSIYSGKKRLFEVCRVFLKENPMVQEQLTIQSKRDLKRCADFIDLNSYFTHVKQEITPSFTYLAKILAGLFILRVESMLEGGESKNMLDQIVKQLENEFETIGTAIDQANSADYYKNVYAKMMGGKI